MGDILKAADGITISHEVRFSTADIAKIVVFVVAVGLVFGFTTRLLK